MAAVDLRASRTGYLTLDQAAAINASDATLAKFVAGLPKAELHLHIEGTVEPRPMLTIARRNGIAIEGADDAERFCAAQRAKRSFRDLQEFLDLYYASCDVLRTEQDFFDICAAYLARAHAAGVVRAEIFFDPQTHIRRARPAYAASPSARVRPHRGRVRPPRAQFDRGDLRGARRKGRARGEAPRLLRGLLRVIGWTYCTYCFCKYFVTSYN